MLRNLALALALGGMLAAAPSEVMARGAHVPRGHGGFVHRHGFGGYYGYGGGYAYPYYFDYSDDDYLSNDPYTYYSPYYRR